MKNITIKPSVLAGEVHIPPSKSMTHRAIVCAFLAEGESQIDHVELSNDIIATCRAVESLGADIDILESEFPGYKKLIIRGKGSVQIARERISCGESGTTARFIIPISRLISDKVIIEGEGKLVDRPFDVFYSIFDTQGMKYQTREGKLPLSLWGALQPGKFEVRGDISSQFISGLLLALPLLCGDSVLSVTTKLESFGYIEMTMAVQRKFGVRIEFVQQENKFIIPGWQKYTPCQDTIEGDWSQAAFWLTAGALGGPITVNGLNPDSLQGDQCIVDFLTDMGANLYWNRHQLISEKGFLNGISMDVSQCPDLVPVLAVLGTLGKGKTVIYNAGRLRIKESDRLQAIATELKALGAKITEKEDSLSITGVEKLTGGRIYGWNDHRIVMAAAIAAMACDKCVTIEGEDAVNKSYPTFWDHYVNMGGKIL